MLIMFTFKWENFSFVFLFGFVLFFITEIRKITRCLHFGWFTFVVHVLLNCIFDLFIHNGKMCFFFFCQNRIGETCEILFFFCGSMWMNEWVDESIHNTYYICEYMKRNRKFLSNFYCDWNFVFVFPFSLGNWLKRKTKIRNWFCFLVFCF